MTAQAFHPDFGERISYAFEDLPEHPDGQVAVTMHRAIDYLREDASAPIVREFAARALASAQAPGRSYGEQCIQGVWNLVRGSMRFQHDDVSAERLAISDPRKNNVIEVLIRPVDQAALIARRGQGFEDCDGYELFAGCLLTALGVPVALVTVSAEPEEPMRFSHVYLAAYLQGRRIPMDFSHGHYIGWECPNTGRIKEWPVRAQPQPVWIPLLMLTAMILGLNWWAKQKETWQ